MNDELPKDYELCADCGFDHSYEGYHAAKAHEQLERERNNEYSEGDPKHEGMCFHD